MSRQAGWSPKDIFVAFLPGPRPLYERVFANSTVIIFYVVSLSDTLTTVRSFGTFRWKVTSIQTKAEIEINFKFHICSYTSIFFIYLLHHSISLPKYIIKKGRQCKAGRERLIPYQTEDPSPTIPTHRRNEETGKTVDKKWTKKIGQ